MGAPLGFIRMLGSLVKVVEWWYLQLRFCIRRVLVLT